MQDPSTYFSEVASGLECAVNPRDQAKLDSTHCVTMNFETYFVSTSDARAKFEANPLAFCGRLTDPVTQFRFTPTKRSPRIDWRGRPFYFSSDSTRARFASRPDSFAVPRIGMIEMSMM